MSLFLRVLILLLGMTSLDPLEKVTTHPIRLGAEATLLNTVRFVLFPIIYLALARTVRHSATGIVNSTVYRKQI